MFQNLLQMATEQSFSIVLLLTIAYILWRTMRADMLKKDARIAALELEFRICIQKHQEDSQRIMLEQQRRYESMMQQQTALMEHTAEVLEQNTLVLQQLMPLAKKLAA